MEVGEESTGGGAAAIFDLYERSPDVKVVVINANPKKKGALATLIEEASSAAAQGGAEVEELRLADLDIGYCKFCMTCYRDTESPIGRCSQEDDMKWILERLKEADAYIIATPVSSGHGNAIFKTFFERCAYTAGSSKGKLLWLKGIPTSRFTDKRRHAVTIATAGTMPNYLRKLCDIATKQMKELSKLSFNAETIGTLYAGELVFKGLKDKHRRKARELGRLLAQAGLQP
ncbi:MAG: flavodoxin family protein [Actinobacteria bacterium]|nr:flavodoxin family protein [Actinomycetota bacterium]